MTDTPHNWSLIHDDSWVNIFSFVPTEQLISCIVLVCKAWNSIAYNTEICSLDGNSCLQPSATESSFHLDDRLFADFNFEPETDKRYLFQTLDFPLQFATFIKRYKFLKILKLDNFHELVTNQLMLDFLQSPAARMLHRLIISNCASDKIIFTRDIPTLAHVQLTNLGPTPEICLDAVPHATFRLENCTLRGARSYSRINITETLRSPVFLNVKFLEITWVDTGGQKDWSFFKQFHQLQQIRLDHVINLEFLHLESDHLHTVDLDLEDIYPDKNGLIELSISGKSLKDILLQANYKSRIQNLMLNCSELRRATFQRLEIDRVRSFHCLNTEVLRFNTCTLAPSIADMINEALGLQTLILHHSSLLNEASQKIAFFNSSVTNFSISLFYHNTFSRAIFDFPELEHCEVNLAFANDSNVFLHMISKSCKKLTSLRLIYPREFETWDAPFPHLTDVYIGTVTVPGSSWQAEWEKCCPNLRTFQAIQTFYPTLLY